MSKKINIRPQTDVYGTYKRLSYQHWSALSEFVDNSTQSFFDHKKDLLETKYYKGLTVEINYVEDSVEGDYITIYDTAYGMDWTDFVRAINLHKPPQNTNGRNEFGMGLKTAACWYGNLWSVETTRLGSDKKYRAEIDVDILEKYKNEEIEAEEEYTAKREHYTLITIKRLNQHIAGPRTKSKVKEMLTSTYRDDIRSGLIDIIFNGEHLNFEEAPIYVEDLGKYKKTWKREISFDVEHKGKTLHVYGFIGIRIPASPKRAGFTLLRRDRVIVGGYENNYRPKEVFGEPNSFVYQRLIGELHMDDWPVTQAKDGFNWNSDGLEDEFIEKLIETTKDYRQKALSIRLREKISTEDVIKDVAKSFQIPGIIGDIKVNVQPVIHEESKIEEKIELTEELSKDIDLESLTKELEEKTVDMVGGNNGEIKFNYYDKEYKFKFIYEVDNIRLPWLTVSEDKTENLFEIHINTGHAFFAPYKDKKEFMTLITKFTLAMVLAEQNERLSSSDGKINPEGIRLSMNNLLDAIAQRGVIDD